MDRWVVKQNLNYKINEINIMNGRCKVEEHIDRLYIKRITMDECPKMCVTEKPERDFVYTKEMKARKKKLDEKPLSIS